MRYIKIMEYPRADKAVFVDAATGKEEEIVCGNTDDALYYEMQDMEQAVLTGDRDVMKLQYSVDVMQIMTQLRQSWGLTYPEEE